MKLHRCATISSSFALLALLAFAPVAFAAGYQPPTLLPLIQQLEKTRHHVEKRVDPAGVEHVNLPPVHKHYLRGVTSVKHPEIVYNLRRFDAGAGGLHDTLYAMLPDVTRQACADSGIRFVVAMQPIRVAPDHHAIVDDTMPLPAGKICIELPGGHYLFTMALAKRVKKLGQDSWLFVVEKQ